MIAPKFDFIEAHKLSKLQNHSHYRDTKNNIIIVVNEVYSCIDGSIIEDIGIIVPYTINKDNGCMYFTIDEYRKYGRQIKFYFDIYNQTYYKLPFQVVQTIRGYKNLVPWYPQKTDLVYSSGHDNPYEDGIRINDKTVYANRTNAAIESKSEYIGKPLEIVDKNRDTLDKLNPEDQIKFLMGGKV